VINAIKEINCFTALFYTDPILFIALHRGLLRRKFAKMFDTHKTRMIELSYVVTICEAVSIEYRNVTDRRTDGQTKLLYQSLGLTATREEIRGMYAVPQRCRYDIAGQLLTFSVVV